MWAAPGDGILGVGGQAGPSAPFGKPVPFTVGKEEMEKGGLDELRGHRKPLWESVWVGIEGRQAAFPLLLHVVFPTSHWCGCPFPSSVIPSPGMAPVQAEPPGACREVLAVPCAGDALRGFTKEIRHSFPR